MLAPKGPTFNDRPTFANPMYLKKAQYEKPCLYEIPYDQSDPANRLVTDKEETLTLEKESRSKLNKDLVRPYDYTKLNSLYEIFKLASQEYHEQLAHANENDSFTFVHKLKQEMHVDLKYVESLENEIDELESDKAEFSNMYDILLQECVSNDVMVIHKTNVSRPQLRSTQMKDKVMPNNSQVKDKKTEVEDHPRISSISNKTKYVTACNDSLKSRTPNVNAVCATCGKCVFNSNYDACVSKYLNDVNARTKKPKVVLISTRKPKSQANKFVATPPKKTVASESTTQKSKSYYRMLYEKTSKAWKWWIEQQCLSGYKWVPKTKTRWVPKVRNENVNKRVSFAIDNASRITNVLKLTNTLGSNLSRNITINRVYYVEGLNHNLLSVGQFCDADLEVAFRKSTCFVRDLQGNDLLTGNRGSDLYIISLQETTSSTLICLMAKASLNQAWLWHRRLSHLNFDYINLLSKKDVVISLPKLKYVKDQLCSSCEVSKAKRSSFKTKVVPISKGRLNLLHMDLCGPMRVASINGKKYILVIVDDYSRYTWTLFLRSKDETPEVLKEFLTMIQRNL
ncbi:retrovirus-related pol polyprotein from transposon TNT 1-94 [Tanacetum coccineum]